MNALEPVLDLTENATVRRVIRRAACDYRRRITTRQTYEDLVQTGWEVATEQRERLAGDGVASREGYLYTSCVNRFKNADRLGAADRTQKPRFFTRDDLFWDGLPEEEESESDPRRAALIATVRRAISYRVPGKAGLNPRTARVVSRTLDGDPLFAICEDEGLSLHLARHLLAYFAKRTRRLIEQGVL